MYNRHFNRLTASNNSLIEYKSRYNDNIYRFPGINQSQSMNKSTPRLTSSKISIRIPSPEFYNYKYATNQAEISDNENKSTKSFKFSKSARKRKRIELLSKAKFPVNSKINFTDLESSFELKPVRYRPITPRLLRLAEPKEYLASKSFDVPEKSVFNNKNDNFLKSSSLRSLKRIDELAKPKKKIELMKKNPYGVNPRALKATCPARIEELAQPKNVNENFMKSLEDYMKKVYIGSQ